MIDKRIYNKNFLEKLIFLNVHLKNWIKIKLSCLVTMALERVNYTGNN